MTLNHQDDVRAAHQALELWVHPQRTRWHPPLCTHPPNFFQRVNHIRRKNSRVMRATSGCQDSHIMTCKSTGWSEVMDQTGPTAYLWCWLGYLVWAALVIHVILVAPQLREIRHNESHTHNPQCSIFKTSRIPGINYCPTRIVFFWDGSNVWFCWQSHPSFTRQRLELHLTPGSWRLKFTRTILSSLITLFPVPSLGM